MYSREIRETELLASHNSHRSVEVPMNLIWTPDSAWKLRFQNGEPIPSENDDI